MIKDDEGWLTEIYLTIKDLNWMFALFIVGARQWSGPYGQHKFVNQPIKSVFTE